MRAVVKSKDFWAGSLFVLLGAMFLLLGLRHPVGSLARMGPGYLPIAMSSLLIAIGLLTVGRSIWRPLSAIEAVRIKPLALISLAVIAFGALLKPLGLAGAITALVFISSYASAKFEFAKTAIICISIVIFCSLVFVVGLGVPISIFGSLWDAG